MANRLGFYFLPKNSINTDSWIAFTDNVKHRSLNWSESTASDPLEFSFEISKETYNSSNAVIIPAPGDQFIVTTDETRTECFYNSLLGIVIDPGQEGTGAYISDEDRLENKNNLTIRQKDYSYKKVTLNYKVPTLLSVILSALLDNSTEGNLGGIDNNGVVIPKVKLLCADVYVNSFEFEGYAEAGLKALLEPLKYNSRLFIHTFPDATTLLRNVTQIEIYKTGSPPDGSSYANGISNDDIRLGGIKNPDYDPSNPFSEPHILFGEKRFKVRKDFDTILNSITLIGMVQAGNTLERYYKKLGDARESTFNLGYKYKDILFGARLIRSKVTINSVPTYSPSITFSIEEFPAEKIENYDQIKADYLVCRIVHDSTEYFYRFTISGQLVTLGALAYGSTALPEALDYNDTFEVVKTVTIYEDNRANTGEDYEGYGAIKNCSLTNSEATFRFLKDDVPRAFDEIVIYGYKLEDYKETHNIRSSIDAYGPRETTETLDYPLTLAQLQEILFALHEDSEPQDVITFLSIRWERLKAGYQFPVRVTGRCNNMYIVTSIHNQYICSSGEKGQHLIEKDVTMSRKRNTLADTLANFKQSHEAQKTVMPRGNEKEVFHDELFFDFSIEKQPLEAPFASISNIVTESSVITGFRANWTAVTGATAYVYNLSYVKDGVERYIFRNKIISLATSAGFDTTLFGLSGTITAYKFSIKAIDGINNQESAFSNIASTTSDYEFITDADQIINLRFNDSDTTVTNEAGYNGTLSDITVIHSEVLGTTTRYVGPFTSPQNISIPHDADFNDIASFTIKFYGTIEQLQESNILSKESGADGSFRFQFSYNGFVASEFAPYIDIYDSNGSHPRLLVYATDFETAISEYFCFGVIWNRTTKTVTLIKNTTTLTKAVYAPNSSFHATEADFNGSVLWNTSNNIRIGTLPTNANPYGGKMFRLYMTKRALEPADLISEFQEHFGV